MKTVTPATTTIIITTTVGASHSVPPTLPSRRNLSGLRVPRKNVLFTLVCAECVPVTCHLFPIRMNVYQQHFRQQWTYRNKSKKTTEINS
ncbi:hypothetical protein Y032_0215g2359 [Ancylostoma ceylanicum]|uniref:Uncharacterized protein n=1 Tax=Ancylostoma ceylanicum TaxID=53326 RepID=A0A016SJA6_9BILA|nr:hypothetical protein Y032_0215g2359 [Ancylostoma ceylanicum]